MVISVWDLTKQEKRSFPLSFMCLCCRVGAGIIQSDALHLYEAAGAILHTSWGVGMGICRN